jgi:hypothetical protein
MTAATLTAEMGIAMLNCASAAATVIIIPIFGKVVTIASSNARDMKADRQDFPFFHQNRLLEERFDQ